MRSLFRKSLIACTYTLKSLTLGVKPPITLQFHPFLTTAHQHPNTLRTMTHSSSDESPSTPTYIDGSSGEGGGQILRNSISYGGILQKALILDKIRANRARGGGCKSQHLTSLRLVKDIAHGRLDGDEMHSTRVSYTPASDANGDKERCECLVGDTGTAGSICLLLQACLPVALFQSHPITLDLRGGTHADMAPQYDYFAEVFLPVASTRFQFKDCIQKLELLRRGYFPRGGGRVLLTTSPLKHTLAPIQMMDRGVVTSISIRAFHAGRVPRHVAKSMVDAAFHTLRHASNAIIPSHLHIHTAIENDTSSLGNAAGILIVVKTSTQCIFGASALNPPRHAPSPTGTNAAMEMIQTLQSGGCVDDWLQDQLILYMALAQGESKIRTGSLTLHTKTAIHVAKLMCPSVQFSVQKVVSGSSHNNDAAPVWNLQEYGQTGKDSGQHIIHCRGIGYRNPSFL